MIYHNCGIHGVKTKYVSECFLKGINRESSAWFIYSTQKSPLNEFKISIFLSIYFSVSLSLLKKIQNENYTWKDWYKSNIEDIPSLILFPYIPKEENLLRYNCDYHPYLGQSLEYTKVKQSGIISSETRFELIKPLNFLELVENYDPSTLHSINMKERFFWKNTNKYSISKTDINLKTELRAANFCSYLEPFYSKIILQKKNGEN